MPRYVILTNRKRAIIALVHTIAFLIIAALTGRLAVHALHSGAPPVAWIMTVIFVLVSAALVTLTAVSKIARERLYFSLCAASAGFGLARQIFGDEQISVAAPARVGLLLFAVVVCVIIMREHSEVAKGV